MTDLPDSLPGRAELAITGIFPSQNRGIVNGGLFFMHLEPGLFERGNRLGESLTYLVRVAAHDNQIIHILGMEA